MSTIVLMNYENYYNRRCLPPKAMLINPLNPGSGDYYYETFTTFSNINFNPNDGVNTELVINWDGEMPNYLIVAESYPLLQPTDTRWYVLNSKRTRSGQLVLTLRRDLVADFYDAFINAPAMIERGRLPDGDPYIINDEGIVFNQIKQREKLLTDLTETPWVVGYVERTDSLNGMYYVESSEPVEADFTTNESLADYYYNSLIVRSAEDTKIGYHIRVRSENYDYIYQFNVDPSGDTTYSTVSGSLNPGLTSLTDKPNTFASYVSQAMESGKASLDTVARNSFLPTIPAYDNTALIPYLKERDGKILKTSDGLWLMKLHKDYHFGTSYSVLDTSSAMFAALDSFVENIPSFNIMIGGQANGNTFNVSTSGAGYRLEFIEYTQAKKYSIPIQNTRRQVSDAAYDIFAIPFGDLEVTLKSGSMIADKWAGLSAGVNLSAQLGGRMYDLQLLPYCPIRNFVKTKRIDISKGVEGVDYSFITQPLSQGETSPVSVILWASTSTFTFDINYGENLPKDRKTTNQCYNYRICSPNYSSIYEFNLAKSNELKGFNVDCVYKPFSPYIHIWPKGGQGSLYGNDFNDPRGLVCSGDFSFTQIQDAWVQYELNNKNYQNMFNRQIETMDLTHKMQRTEQGINIATGALSGGMTAFGGTLMASGNPVAAGVIGGAAAVVSTGAGIADYAMSEKLRANERSQAYAMFNMSNENIRAMPDTLTKVSAFNPNNKIFPVYEVYSATDKEIAAFQNYIKYYGMTVGRIGSVAEYLWPSEEFIQGRFIRFDNLAENTNIAAELNSEFMKGVYMKQ